MRSSTGGEQTVLAATFRKTYYRVDIADALGVMQDMSSLASYGWMQDVELDLNVDQSIAQATITLRREIDIVGGHSSLSPLRTDSPANTSGPAIGVYRACKVYIAVVTGSRPSALSTDWKLKLDGVTDRVSMPEQSVVQVFARDKGAYLMDQWVRDTGAQLGGQQTLEAIINALLRYAPVDGEVLSVSVPTDPDFIVSNFPLKPEPTMTAIQRAAELAASDFRFAWDEVSGSYVPTLSVPDRTSPTSSWTFSSADVIGWKRVDLDRLSVRNQVIISYRSKDSTYRSLVTVEDLASVGLYGRRVLTIQEADDSAIDSATEATTLANLILADLKDPRADAEVEMLPDWRVELNDFVTFSGNRFFDLDQDLAVVGIKYVLTPDSQRMFLTLRGNPSAGYRRWIERARDLDFDALTPADNGISNLKHTDDDTTGIRTYTWERGANVAFIAFYETLAAAPLTDSAWPDAGDVLGMVTAGTSGASVLSSSTNRWVASKPPRGQQRFAIAVPYWKLGGGFQQGDAVKFILDPLPSAITARLVEAGDVSDVDLVLWVTASASDWPVLVEVWQGDESGAADYSYSVSANTVDADAVAMNLKNLAIPLLAPRAWSVKATGVGGEIVRSAYTETRFDALGPVMDVVGTPGTTDFTITYTVVADTFEYSVDGGAYTSVPASPFTVSRNASGGADKILTFKAERNDQATSSMITVPAQVATSSTITAIITAVWTSAPNYATNQITVNWAYTGSLGAGDFELIRIRTAGLTADHGGTQNSQGTTGSTSKTDSLPDDIVASGGAFFATYSWQVRVRDGAGVTLRVSEWYDQSEEYN